MRLVLAHRHNPVPIWLVEQVSEDGKNLLVLPLFGPLEGRKIIPASKADMRLCGYYPMEVEDAVVAQLQA